MNQCTKGQAISQDREDNMLNIIGYDLLGKGNEGIRYAWGNDRFKNYVESAAFTNRSKGKDEGICGYTTSESSGCVLRTMGQQCLFCRTGNNLPFGGFLSYKEIAKQNVFMVLTDMYCTDHPELANKEREFAYMGQGEPGYSYSQVRMAIELTNSIMKDLGQKVHRHIFATCGILEAIKSYVDDIKNFYTEKVTLHLSLHAANERSLLMPINTTYPLNELISIINTVYDISQEKPCVGIMLFNQFSPKGKEFTYTNSLENVIEILERLDAKKCRLSFCEYNPSSELGSAEEYPSIKITQLLDHASAMGFEAKFFSSFGAEKQTACGMLGGKDPERKVLNKWIELEKVANELIVKHTVF